MNMFVLILLGFGHMIADIHQGAIPTLMLYLRDAFNLSYAQVGIIILVTNLSSSVVQPMFGLYSDRSSMPWIMPIGLGLAAIGMSLVGIMPHYYLAVIVVFISGLGVAAYHPEASKTANFAAGDRKSSAMSVFSVGGNLGHGFGAILASLFLGTWGLGGSVAFLVPGLITALAFYFLLPKVFMAVGKTREAWHKKRELASAQGTEKTTRSWGLIILMIIVIIRSWIQYGLSTYLPFYYTDVLGGSKQIAAVLVSVFLISGAAGTLIGGPLADRFGTKTHICFSMALTLPLLFLLLHAGGGTAALVVTALSGMVLISTFSPAVVMGQQYLPHNIGLASGLLIGFAVGIGGLGVPVLGTFADNYGVELVLKILAVLPLAGLVMGLLLPKPPEEEMKVSLSKTG